MALTREFQLASLENFLKVPVHQHITYATPSSPNYASLRETFSLDNPATPLAIVRPQSAEDVALLIKFSRAYSIPVVIRTGGHNVFGQSMAENALTIDMRDISFVKVQEDKSLAKIGGGVLMLDLVTKLQEECLAATIGTFPTIGWAGWAIYGGYGPLSPNFGLGVHQILGAKIVNSDGKIIEADNKLLKGIRGAGGNFGPIVELTIKVYPLKKVLHGTVIFELKDFKRTIRTYYQQYDELSSVGLPQELSLMEMFVTSPHGKAMVVTFMWSSEDFETGRAWLEKTKAMGTVVMDTVAEGTLPGFLEANAPLLPASVYSFCRTHSVLKVTPEVAEFLGAAVELMPENPATMLCLHQCRNLPSAKDEGSVFGTRGPHFMIEIIGGSTIKETWEQTLNWAEDRWEKLQHVDIANLLPTVYVSLDPPTGGAEKAPLSRLFGNKAADVLALKQEFDPENVFDLAVPRLKNFSY